jgi:hypothetical protein
MKLPLILMLVLLLPLAYAEISSNSQISVEFTFKPSYNNSGVVAVMNPIAQNYTKGILYDYKEGTMVIPPIIIIVGGGGGGGAVSGSYLLKVDTIGKWFRPDQNIKALVSIYNLGTYNTSGARIKTYFESPKGNQTEPRYYNLPGITPACLLGSYRLGFNDCKYGDDLLSAMPYEYQVNMSLPSTAIKGKWKFFVELEPPGAEYLKTYVNFSVLSLLNYFIIFLLICGILIFIIVKRRKKRRLMMHAQDKGKRTQA